MGATPSKISNENPMQNARFKRTNATRRLRIKQNSRLRKTNATRRLNILKTSQFKGPLCDPIGFSQHTGECWHDTMLQMLFFSDGLKEITQPLFYNLKNAEIYNYIRSKSTTNELFINAIAKYIISIRDRFVNHYNYINDPDMDLVCNPKEGRNLFNYMKKEMKPSLVQMKRNESMKLGIMSANMALKLTAEKNNKWKKNLENVLSNSYTLNTIKPHGATLDTSMKVLSMILTLFNLQYGIIKHADVDFDPFKYVKEYREVAGLYVSGNLYSASETSDGYDYYLVYHNLYKYYGRHAVGFIKCNNVWSYFDDNYGLMNANVGGRLLHIIKRDYINEKKRHKAVESMLNHKPSLDELNIPSEIFEEILEYYDETLTLSDLLNRIPIEYRCKHARLWIIKYVIKILGGKFNHDGWVIDLPVLRIRGGRSRTTKKYYCPNGFRRTHFTRRECIEEPEYV
jgi:hypothetical protein